MRGGVGYLAAVLALAAVAASAQAPDWREARGQLFETEGTSVEVLGYDFLTEQDRAIIGEVARQQDYYGAVALSPDEGLMSEATVAGANHHSIPAAEAQALAACNGRRAEGARACVVVAHVLPQGYEARPLQLSKAATAAAGTTYREARAPKAMAISPATGGWTVARGGDSGPAAIASCNEEALERGGVEDCAVAIED